MINFKGRCISIQNADRITRTANSIYPHISESRTALAAERQLEFLSYDSLSSRKFQDLKFKNLVKLKAMRMKELFGMDLFRQIICMLKEQKMGNCYELSRLAEFIAKVNGQNNVYPMKIVMPRNSSGADFPVGHVVSVITDKPINSQQKYVFKNKEAIILDPWLGITDYVSRYAERLKNDFKHNFQFIPDNDINIRYITKIAKNLKQYKDLKKGKCFNPDIKFVLHEEDIVSKEQAKQLRTEYPELVLKNFKKAEL